MKFQQLSEMKGLQYEPAKNGFVFSNAEIHAAIDKDRRLYQGRNHRFHAPQAQNSARGSRLKVFIRVHPSSLVAESIQHSQDGRFPLWIPRKIEPIMGKPRSFYRKGLTGDGNCGGGSDLGSFGRFPG